MKVATSYLGIPGKIECICHERTVTHPLVAVIVSRTFRYIRVVGSDNCSAVVDLCLEDQEATFVEFNDLRRQAIGQTVFVDPSVPVIFRLAEILFGRSQMDMSIQFHDGRVRGRRDDPVIEFVRAACHEFEMYGDSRVDRALRDRPARKIPVLRIPPSSLTITKRLASRGECVKRRFCIY
ncbi:MAG: hypothetical protein IPO41_14810 [Acidobacteria bacterium]|nr:hypothetical protein [Acidobacteriota bacterium]